jgi:transposase
MPRTRNPYPTEFREQIVELHLAGWSVEDLAREFEPCAATIHGWVMQAARDGGKRADILSSEEREEHRRLRRENKQLRRERDILSKAAAWFAQNDAMPSRSPSS